MTSRIRRTFATLLLVSSWLQPDAGLRGQTDCNANEMPDVEEIAAGLATDCNADGRPDECEVVPLTFVAGDPLPVVSIPRDVASGDLDGDGKPDAIVVSRQVRLKSTVAIFFSREGRSFQKTVLDLPESIRRLILTDLDRDGDLDMVSTHRESIYVHMNLGPGLFVESVGYAAPVPARVETLVAADLNGNGLPELIAAVPASDELVVFPGLGEGQFGDGVVVPAGDSPSELGSGDFDGDGQLDIAVVHRNGDEVGIYAGDGSGSLTLSRALPLTSTRPFYLEVADLSGDGVSDLVTMGAGVLEVSNQLADGVFAEPVAYASGGSDLAVADFDRDGDPDVASNVTGGVVRIRFNDGRGGLSVAREIVSGIQPNFMLAGDYDADGKPDFAYVNSSRDAALHVLWSGAAGSFSMRRTDIPLFGCLDSRGCRPHGGTSGDFDGDGYPEVLVSNTHPGTFSLIRNDGAGNLEFLGNSVFGGEHPQSVAAGDIDGDGDVDALTVDNIDNNLYVHANPGDGMFARPVRYPVGGGAINVRLYDLDADGFLDAISSNQSANTVSVLFNQGDGTFAAGRARDYPVRGAPKSAEGGDFNGDGLGDVVSGNSGSARVTVFLGEADRGFGLPEDYVLSHPPHHVATADLDKDGDVDIVAALITGNSVGLLLNRGDGTFGDAVTLPLGASPYSITAVDLDVDGVVDLITGNESNNSVSILIGAGDGGFAAPRHVAAGAGLRFILPGDFDLDGDLDFGTSNRGGNSVTVLHQESLQEIEDFRETICTPAEFRQYSAASPGAGGERFIKFLLPARNDPSLLPPLFQNTRRYELHQDFLAQVFAERFPVLSSEDYTRLVGLRATRDYFVGALRRLPPKAPGAVQGPDTLLFGFSVFANFRDPVEALSEAEVAALYNRLRSVFRLDVLAYAPTLRDAVETAAAWQEPSFPVHLQSAAPALAFESYTRGVGYGRVRRLSAEAFAAANELGQFGFQDILVLEEAPRDIEGVSAGVITAQRQGGLSHVAVRTARRGTPNAYVRDALAVFEPLEGQLVRLEVTATGYSVEVATRAVADIFWAENRPQLSTVATIDESFQGFPTLEELAVQEAKGVAVEARFGGKASNLARLQTILEPPSDRYRMQGFAIPVYYYMQFLRKNRLPSLLDATRDVTYEEYIAELASDPNLQSDSRLRFDALQSLRDHMDGESAIDPDLVAALAARIEEVFQSTIDRVRFRSSSNVEDAIEFNGAGLYDSTSVCVQDDLDADEEGPSHCDPERANERRIERGLRKVWASLWNFRAYEERAFYGLDQTQTAMAILVNQSFVAEQINGVAFTGNPSNGLDRRYVVSAQPGEESVVSPDPGVAAEKNVLEMTADGRVGRIVRATKSSLVPEGVAVLSDERLRELGELLWLIDRQLPVDLGGFERHEVLFDIEFKVTAESALVPKQVRPFLLADPGPPPPTFALAVPNGFLCGAFQNDRGLASEFELKSQLLVHQGVIELPTSLGEFGADWVDELVVGAAQEVAEPVESGLVRVRLFPGANGRTTYSFEYQQNFALPSGEPCVLEIGPLNYVAEGNEQLGGPTGLAETLLDGVGFASLRFPEREGVTDIRYLPCDFGGLAHWEIVIEEAAATFYLEERFLEHPTETGPARLVSAQVTIREEKRTVEDYWRLVYTASRHNERVSYRVVFATPLAVDGIDAEVHAVDLIAPEARERVLAAVHYLDARFERVGSGAVRRFERSQPTQFVRGDSDSDGRRAVTDAVLVLAYLFDGGTPPMCRDAADVNDDGRLNLVDPLALLDHVLRGATAPAAPSPSCGSDPSLDGLGCDAFAACP